MFTPMSIGKIIVIQPHTIYISLKRQQVKQALLWTWAVLHDLKESKLKNHYYTTTSALQQVCKILVKTEQTGSKFWAKHVGSQYPQNQLLLLCDMSMVSRIWCKLLLQPIPLFMADFCLQVKTQLVSTPQEIQLHSTMKLHLIKNTLQ